MQTAEPIKIGNVGDDENIACVRIVHVSDTHMYQDKMLAEGVIPHGDILVHSGDFANYRWRRRFGGFADVREELEQIDAFFGKCPHQYKIFVAGNHETNFEAYSPELINSYLSNGIYLQDSYVTLKGIKIYGSPWNNKRWYSNAGAFSASDSEMKEVWKAIPEDADIVVTHNPPHGILDLATMSHWKNFWRGQEECRTCNGVRHEHPRFARRHWGCPHLRNAILNQVKPKAHFFGHVHGENGIREVDGVIFSNAALKQHRAANVLDYYVSGDSKETSVQPTYNHRRASRNCLIL